MTGNLILHGAYAQSSTLADSVEFDRKTGIAQTLVHIAQPMQHGLSYLAFPQTLLDTLWNKSQLTLLSWGTWDYQSGHAWTWEDIVGHKYDGYLRTWAQAAAAWKHPFFIRLDHEVNGTWADLPWLALVHSDPQGFLASWRYIVDLFRQDGATNVTWVWNINSVAPAGAGTTTDADKVAALYPGDQWVDWTSYDAYNWAGSKPGTPWLTWQQITSGYSNWIGDTYSTLLQVAPTKPILVGEVGCERRGGPTGITPNGDKTAWILDFLKTTPVLYPAIAAISYFQRDYTGGPYWSIDGYDGAAWKTGVTGPGYVQPGMIMPPDLLPIAPYRLAQVSGSPLLGADQAALLTQAHAATQVAQDATTALEGLVRARKVASAAEDAAVD